LCGLILPSQLDIIGKAYSRIPASDGEARSFLAHLILALIDDDKSSYPTVESRTNAFFQQIGMSVDTIEHLTLLGQIENIDLRGKQFRNCFFKDTAFINCVPDKSTVFDLCTFSGVLDLTPPDGWGEAQILKSCTIRSPATLTLQSASAVEITDLDDLLLDAMRLGLTKFWQNGRPRDMIKRDDWRRGLLSKTRYCDTVLESLRKSGVVRESEKGRYDVPYLLLEKDCFGELQKFIDHGSMTGKFLDAFRRLKNSESAK